jgi:hypothetical protein
MSLPSWSPEQPEILSVTAQKIVGDSGALLVTVNGNINSTANPYGSVTVVAEIQP